MVSIKGTIVTVDKAAPAVLNIEQGRIVSITDQAPSGADVHDYGKALIVPGFIDVHMHGMGGHLGANEEDIMLIGKDELRFGTTGFLPTQGGISAQEFVSFGQALRRAAQQLKGCGAKPVGAHFEGPFINPERKGGFDFDHLRPATEDECKYYLDQVGDVIKLVTLSPELDHAEKVIAMLVDNGIVVSAGHTIATRDQFLRAVDYGITHITHLFNTFSPPSWAELGVWDVSLVETALMEPRVNCEVICDMQHVHPTHVKMVAKLLDPYRFIGITDSCPAGGYEPGEYIMWDGRSYSTRSGAGRLVSDGTLIGSVLTMDKAFKNLVEICDLDIVTVARYLAANPARDLGIDNQVGTLEPGKLADIAVLSPSFECLATYVDGTRLYQRQ